VANNDFYTVAEDNSLTVPPTGVLSGGGGVNTNGVKIGIGVLANDFDQEGDPLSAVLELGPAHGSLTLNADGSFIYKPNADYNGTDSFTYRASDGAALSGIATVTINITPVSDRLSFTAMQMTSTGFELHVAGDGSPYVISASTDLHNWTPIFTNAVPNGPTVYTDTAARNYPMRYYRVDGQ
jgi:VCBS repeat-containing protein